MQVPLLLETDLPEARESAAAVLSELARSQSANRHLIAEAEAIEPLVLTIREGNAGAQKHATCALWGLTQEAKYRAVLARATGAVSRLVELLKGFAGETQARPPPLVTIHIIISSLGHPPHPSSPLLTPPHPSSPLLTPSP